MLLVPGSVYACRKLSVRVQNWHRPSGHFAHTPNEPHRRSSCFAHSHQCRVLLVESCCCQRADAMPCWLLVASSTDCTDWQCFWYQAVCMRAASYLCASKTGTVRRDISLTHPTNHIGGRVVSLTHTNVEYFWSSRAAVSERMPCHASC